METNPSSLPEFDASPLNEVVVGIQFHPPTNYQQIRAFQVWELYKKEFSAVQELPPLPAQFETFGLPVPQFQFNMMSGAVHDRFWFLKEPGDQLIQFQQDRLLHNWRKIDDHHKQQYPRFENIISQFSDEVSALERYFFDLGHPALQVTQFEVSYVNRIPLPDASSPFLPQDWFAFVQEDHPPVDEFMSTVKHVLRDTAGSPYGRLYRESATGSDGLGRRGLSLTLTCRGRPAGESIAEALESIKSGRYMITEEFLRATTKQAQQKWKRRS